MRHKILVKGSKTGFSRLLVYKNTPDIHISLLKTENTWNIHDFIVTETIIRCEICKIFVPQNYGLYSILLFLTFWVDLQKRPKNKTPQVHRWLVTFIIIHVPLLIQGDGRQGAVSNKRMQTSKALYIYLHVLTTWFGSFKTTLPILIYSRYKYKSITEIW